MKNKQSPDAPQTLNYTWYSFDVRDETENEKSCLTSARLKLEEAERLKKTEKKEKLKKIYKQKTGTHYTLTNK